MKFTVITVCLNPGGKLEKTLNSILQQTYTDVEVVLKDGGSTDGSVAEWQRKAAGIPGADRVKVYVEKDKGIYDAMNQAAVHAEGEFVLFLNCGDVFCGNDVLEKVNQAIEVQRRAGTDCSRMVLYGDTYSEKNQAVIVSAPVITGFVCYRNIPCHRIMIISCGAFIMQRRQCAVSAFRWRHMKAEVTRRAARTGSGTGRSIDRLQPAIWEGESCFPTDWLWPVHWRLCAVPWRRAGPFPDSIIG